MLGYFRDPDVAFVVGPQVYGNYDNVLTRSAESQQYMFHAVVQRAGNRYGVPMLVGTNNAVRISAIMAIHGLQDSITEDFATGLLLHGQHNPDTNNRWKSVYTPDVLAVGEGPSSWTDYFTQQHRWSRGTHEILLQPSFPKLMFRLGFKRMFYYSMLMVYYPLTALTWLVGALNAVLYLVLSIKGVKIPFELWLMLYIDAGLFQTVLYLWNRRHNVSPHEAPGSSGLAGMFISLVCAPVYASSFIGSVLRRRAGFVITPKGQAATADRLLTFRKNIQWAGFYAVVLGVGVQFGHFHSAMWFWSVLRMLLCLAPIFMWKLSKQGRRKDRQPEAVSPPPVRVREMETAA
jgi:cellulose synthase/poly-beta-1,6-N-acetylglucosamine synthase-like glycosyltransferase